MRWSSTLTWQRTGRYTFSACLPPSGFQGSSQSALAIAGCRTSKALEGFCRHRYPPPRALQTAAKRSEGCAGSESSKRYSKDDQRLHDQKTQMYDSCPSTQFTTANACYGGACRGQLFAFALQERAKTSYPGSVGYLHRVAEPLIEDGLLPGSLSAVSGAPRHASVRSCMLFGRGASDTAT